MNAKEVHDGIRDNLIEFFGSQGFKCFSGKGGGGFKKKTSFGFIELVYGISNYSPKFAVDGIGYMVRFDVVEEICTKFTQTIDSISDVKKQLTIGGGYAGLLGLNHYDFGEMVTPGDIEKSTQRILSAYNETLKPFLDKHSDIRFLEKEINGDTERHLPYTLYWRGKRAMRGTILAKLCGNPRYDELKKIYRQKCLRQDNVEVVAAYDNLVHYLDNEYKAS